MKRNLFGLFGGLIVIAILILFEKGGCQFNYTNFKKGFFRFGNIGPLYDFYLGEKVDYQEINGTYLAKEKYQNGYLLENEVVLAIKEGIVVFRGFYEGEKVVVIKNNKNEYWYYDLASFDCQIYERVSYGQCIGTAKYDGKSYQTYVEVKNAR